jgi:hypothetical protein
MFRDVFDFVIRGWVRGGNRFYYEVFLVRW